jgi:hypothetical protein
VGVRGVSYIFLSVKNEGGGGQVVEGWYHKFVNECNLIPLVTEGSMQNFINLVQPPQCLHSPPTEKNKSKGGRGGGGFFLGSGLILLDTDGRMQNPSTVPSRRI